jgi:protein TonB
MTPEIELGGEAGALGSLAADAVAAPAPVPDGPPPMTDPILAAPPELPPAAVIEPLPEVPDLPTARQDPPATESGTRPANRTSSRAGQAGGPAGTTAASTSGGSSARSQGTRLAAGRMPPPSYPAEARRRNQQGTVIVAFTVAANGGVLSAQVERPSPWPLLNDAAVRAVRRWRFPAGPVMQLRQPVVFQLR